MRLHHLFGWLLILVAGTSPALAAPILQIDDPVWNVGQITAGKELSRTFTVENRGDETLVIDNIEQCCGFLGTVEKNRLLPGDKTALNVRLKPVKMVGNLQVEIFLLSNDPLHPRTSVTAFGDVLPIEHALGELLLPEGFIDLGVIPPAEPVPFTVRIKSVGNRPLQIVGIDKGSYVLEDGSRPVLAPGEDGVLNFRYQRESRGPIDEELTLSTNDPLERTLTVRLKGYVYKEPSLPKDAILVYPVGGPVAYSQELGGYRYQVKVENRSEQAVELLPPASSLPAAASQGGGVVAAGDKGTVSVTYPAGILKNGPADGRIYLQLVLPVALR